MRYQSLGELFRAFKKERDSEILQVGNLGGFVEISLMSV